MEREVDPAYAACAVMAAAEKRGKRPAFLFPKVKGHDVPVVSNILATHKRIDLSLGVVESGLNASMHVREEPLLKPELVADSPVRGVHLLGGAGGSASPASRHPPRGRPGPYITGGAMVVRDPETDICNVGVYRH